LGIDKHPSTRDKILQYMLIQSSSSDGGTTVKEIADVLEISINATRQYLIVLEKEGLVIRRSKKSSTGRPAILYSLHESALEAFPKEYRDFSVRLLDVVQKHLGTQKTRELLKEIGKQIADDTRPMLEATLGGKSSETPLKERLEGIIKVYEQFGKYPELVENEDSFELRNYNCLVFGLVQQNPLVCEVDETIVSELAGVDAKKEKCIRDGDGVCLYRVFKKKSKIS
jgi:DeoR family suf operon transcriptional repressor